jgi:hypothetical protein
MPTPADTRNSPIATSTGAYGPLPVKASDDEVPDAAGVPDELAAATDGTVVVVVEHRVVVVVDAGTVVVVVVVVDAGTVVVVVVDVESGSVVSVALAICIDSSVVVVVLVEVLVDVLVDVLVEVLVDVVVVGLVVDVVVVVVAQGSVVVVVGAVVLVVDEDVVGLVVDVVVVVSATAWMAPGDFGVGATAVVAEAPSGNAVAKATAPTATAVSRPAHRRIRFVLSTLPAHQATGSGMVDPGRCLRGRKATRRG